MISKETRFRRDALGACLLRRAPNCGIPVNSALSSTFHSMLRPMVIPNCAFISNSMSWIIRSLSIRGIPAIFSSRSCIAVHHLGGGLVNSLAKLMMSRWNPSSGSHSSAVL